MTRRGVGMRGALWLGVAIACLGAVDALAKPRPWRLWPTPFEDSEIIDQTQVDGGGVVSIGPQTVGQTFVPTRSPLLRVELRGSNVSDPRPGRVKLWRWRGDHAQTVSQTPLFEDALELSGRAGYQERSFFPRIDVEPGATYYFELSGEGRGGFAVQRSRVAVDAYLPGRLLAAGRADPKRASWDLWFRTYSQRAGPPAPAAPLEASDPKRPWSAPPAREPDATRGAYLERIRAHADSLRGRIRQACAESLLHRAALLQAFLYRVSCDAGRCDEEYAEAVRDLLRGASAFRFCTPRDNRPNKPCKPACDPEPDIRNWWFEVPVQAYRWTRSSPSYSPADHDLVRELFLDTARRYWPKREIGLGNRPLKAALGYLALSQLYPGAPHVREWRAYADERWSELWTEMDSPEESAQYTAVNWMPAVLQLAELRGEEERLWNDPRFLALVDRLGARIAPLGIDPNFGDGSGWARDPAGLVWLLEAAATHTREPHYRWLAQRLYAYNAARARDDRPQDDSLFASLHYLGFAWLAADASLVPAPSAQGSRVTRRRRGGLRPRGEWGDPPWRTFEFEEGLAPDKLVLRSGSDPDDLHAVVNLVRNYDHGQDELGAFVSLVDGGSVLMTDSPYPYANHLPMPEDESAPQLRRHWGGAPQTPGREAEVTALREAKGASVAFLEWNDLHGWGVRQERRIFFVKNRFVWVRDRFTFPTEMGASIGPVWHAGDVHPSSAEGAYEIYFREPLGNSWKLRNPERYALIHFVPREGTTTRAFLQPSYLPPEDCPDVQGNRRTEGRCRAGPPYVVEQRWTGEAAKGESRWFDSLILPHGPDLPPGQAAGQVRVLHAGPAAAALEVRIGNETWTLVDNPGGGPLEAGDLAIEGSWALLGSQPEAAPYVLTDGTTRLQRGELIYRWPEATSVELGEPSPSRP